MRVRIAECQDSLLEIESEDRKPGRKEQKQRKKKQTARMECILLPTTWRQRGYAANQKDHKQRIGEKKKKNKIEEEIFYIYAITYNGA